MKRTTIALLILFFILFAIGLLLYFYNNNHDKKRALIKELTPLSCDLNLKDCDVFYKNSTVKFSVSSRPIVAMQEFDLIISGLDNCEDMSAKIYGLNMYMGSIVPKFKKQNNLCVAKTVLSTCTLKTMRFRIELFRGKKSLEIYSDLDIQR